MRAPRSTPAGTGLGSPCPMKAHPAARWILAYGLFLIVAGIAGFLSNPEKAKTALMSGGTAGILSLTWGWAALRGHRWGVWAALATTTLLALVFAWRATASWQAVGAGNQDKVFAASLITLMLVASVSLLSMLGRSLFSLRTRSGKA